MDCDVIINVHYTKVHKTMTYPCTLHVAISYNISIFFLRKNIFQSIKIENLEYFEFTGCTEENLIYSRH
jgi:hypothetical protein